MTDFVFALIAFVLGYFFSWWILFSGHGWGVSAFTTAYLLTVSVYLTKKGAFVNSLPAWFWFIVTWVAGASFSFWDNEGFNSARVMFLFCSAVYYVIVASGRTIMGKTSNYLFADGINAVILIPFSNIINQYVSFSVLGKKEKRGKALSVLFGILVSFVLALILVPLLLRADSGGFGIILNSIADVFKFITTDYILYAIFAIPIAAYVFGLISGAAHKKGTDIIKQEASGKTIESLRFLQPATVYIVFGAVCGIFLVFIFSQIPYFFSAFTGKRPEGWLVYADYARQGFFELCGIAAINFVILMAGNMMCKKRRDESPILKAFIIALAIITLVLIATAFSKMALYIGAYGLTMPRLLPCVFMAFLAAVFLGLIALQKWDFPLVRCSLVTGAVIVCALCLSNPDAMVVRYNTDRYLNGTLAEYDTDILFRAGSAGVLPALEVYETTSDEELKEDLVWFFKSQTSMVEDDDSYSISSLSLESNRAYRRLAEIEWDTP